MASKFTGSDDHFRYFANSLSKAIDKYGSLPEVELVERQRAQIEALVEAEKDFRQTLIKHPLGANVYKSFIRMIKDDRKNILAARPYFRERQSVFARGISPALKDECEKTLFQYHFNYQFVRFVVNARKWGQSWSGLKLLRLSRKISNLRTEIIEMNMPLAIHQARRFWSNTPQAQLAYMDLIQIACEGLMQAVDKFVLPYSPVFRSVAIGRMLGNFISNYSETLLHFFPQDKKRLYRANKLVHKYKGGDVDFEKLAVEVNRDVDDDEQKISGEELADLMAAASTVSADAEAPGCEDSGDSPERYPADEETRPDVKFERAEVFLAMGKAIEGLSPLERKILKMKGLAL